ncbi:ubiquitin-protein ligase [Lithospermum erythrorhizon]|uniref:Ubiquitin-protein ligase n=1 Tax=Lithospermum erythrorhizon TaxID=34254 RepID=A0AAV3NL92_LITER
MSNQVVSVKREVIASCMTCPLCDKLLRDATTISECLHTFCRKCIFKKLSDEEYECCPICNIDLGCVPLEKLRPDHSLQDVRAKIFPYKRRKVEAPEIESSFALPLRRKERSLSSLVVSAPRTSAYGGLTGRRSKSARKAAKGSTFSIEKPTKKQEDSEDLPERSSSPETLKKFTQSIKQNSSVAEPSSCSASDKVLHNGFGTWDGKSDAWNPLSCLVEAAHRSKQTKFEQSGSVKSEPSENGGYVRKSKLKENGQKSKLEDEKNRRDPSISESEKPKKLRKVRQKKTPEFGHFNVSPQTVLDGANIKSEKRTNPIWFSLVASDDQEGDEPLQQISASYLRIKDGNIPVSFIQKYLVRKLDLRSEDEVEIRCMGRAIVPTWQLNHLVDLWLQSTSSDRVSAAIGSSAKDFVMVLAYARRVQAL